jgi:ankyrin repeat protein
MSEYTEHTEILLTAVRQGDLGRVKELLESVIDGVHEVPDIDAGDRCECTALHFASEEGNTAMVKLLVKKGAIVNITNMWDKTPLHSACNNGHLEVVKYLVENGARLEATSNKKRFTPLHLASQYDHVAVAKYLIEEGILAFLNIPSLLRTLFLMHTHYQVH